jgi:L-aspartate oxidase
MNLVKTEVLVIGAGGAGLRAALAAFDAGAQVRVVVNGKLGRTGATAFPVSDYAGFQASDGCNPDDTPQRHFDDIMTAALGACDPKLARIAAEESPLALRQLEEWGVEFVPDGNHHQIGKACFSSAARSHRILGHGEPIVRALGQQLQARGIPVDENTMVSDLIVRDGECVGAIALGIGNEPTVYEAKSVVLATGGAGRLFRMNLNPVDINGSSHALALDAGAELVNMEFMQAGLAFKRPLGLLGAWVWEYEPELFNSESARFLANYLPPAATVADCYADKARHYPFSARDNSRYIESSISQEIRAGRKVYLDLRSIKDREGFRKRPLYPWMKKKGFDLLEQEAEIAVYAHALNGGVRIDEDGQSTVPGLFAAGEAAGGPHGADRLGGGMLSVSQVFGRRAGVGAARWARRGPSPELKPGEYREAVSRLQEMPSGGAVPLEEVRARLQGTMFDHLVIDRHAHGMEQARKEVSALQEIMRNDLDPKEVDARDLVTFRHLFTVAEVILGAAGLRRESRGGHYRSDFPQRDERLNGVIHVSRKGGFEFRAS